MGGEMERAGDGRGREWEGEWNLVASLGLGDRRPSPMMLVA